MQQLSLILISFMVLINLTYAEDNWIWSKARNQKVRSYYPTANNRVYYTDGEQYTRVERDREQTTKRPIPGQQQNDDIDDYNDANDEPVKQNSPYIPNGGYENGGNPRFGGAFNGFPNYPQIGGGGGGGFPGNTANGVLVGPGGPTGIIGRPQSQFPSGLGPSTFPTGQVGGYPGYPQNFPGSNVNGNAGFPGYNGLNNGLGQYPNPQQFGGAQYPQAQYPQGQYPQGQFPQGQYPQNQYPGLQYPGNHQFTEGYGLANLNPGFNANLPSNFNGYPPNYGFGYDEYPAQVEGKSANVKSAKNKSVDDKVAKNLKKL